VIAPSIIDHFEIEEDDGSSSLSFFGACEKHDIQYHASLSMGEERGQIIADSSLMELFLLI